MKSARDMSARSGNEVHAHKFFAPSQVAGAIPRQAILERLGAARDARVIVLQGPAGHGKSTAMQQIGARLEASGWRSGWMTFDEADNDLRRLLVHLQALLGRMQGSGSEARRPATTKQAGSADSDWAIDRLARIDQPTALFFDDFQTLTHKAGLTFFRQLLQRLPATVQVFIGTRSLPELGLARLIVSGQALLLRADDLRFSADEVATFFAGVGELDVRREELDSIYRQTEGWPAAVQLFRLALARPSVRRALDEASSWRPRELAEYLADNVLALQPAPVREFLMRTALLKRLSAPLCDAVMGGHDSQAMLRTLEQSGLFLRSLDADLQWFQYHTLFSAFLAEQLHQADPGAAAVVHRRAADWHAREGLQEETIEHALACRDFTLAADTLSDWSTRLVAGAQLATVERWAERLPPGEIDARPDLAIRLAYTYVFLRRHAKLKRLQPLFDGWLSGNAAAPETDPSIVLSMAAVSDDNLARAEAIISRVRLRGQEASGFSAFELAAGANLVSFCALSVGDFERARDHLVLAGAYNKSGDATFSGGYTQGLVGVNLMVQGELGEALARFRAAMAEQSMHIDESFASAALSSCYIWALYEAHELDLAESLFEQHHHIIADSVLLDFLAVAFIAMARIHDLRGCAAQALDVLDEAETIGHANGWSRLVRLVNWERVRRALLGGNAARARAIAGQAELAAAEDTTHRLPAGWLPFSEDAEGETFGRIRMAIHAQDYDTATTRIAEATARCGARTHRRIRLLLLDALLHLRRGGRHAAQRLLRKALVLAEPGGVLRPFLDEGPELVRLLQEETAAAGETITGVGRVFLQRLLAAAGVAGDGMSVSVTLQPFEPLTDREREILVFLANGVSNKEMANRIFVSENTVKFHLKNIYSKLSVGTRLQAITTARQLGLIH